ncbi:MAG: AMIN domain-containing protein [Methylocella sp.]
MATDRGATDKEATDRVSPGRSVARVRSALFRTGITGTANTKPTRKSLIRNSGPIKIAMAADVIRKTAAAVDAVPAITAMKRRSGSISGMNPGWRTSASKATVFRRSSPRRFAFKLNRMTLRRRLSRRFPPCSSPVRRMQWTRPTDFIRVLVAGAGAKRKWRSTKHIAAKRGLPLSRSRIEPRAFRELES